jgi:hypothetical protein
MSLPYEQSRSLANTRRFLLDLCVPGKIKRVPREVRRAARSLAKHYPMSWDLPRIVEDDHALIHMREIEDNYLAAFWDNARR